MIPILTRLALAVLGLALLSPEARADVFRVGDYTLQRGIGPGAYELSVAVPQILESNAPITLPANCRQEERERISEGLVMRYAIRFSCEGGFAPDAAIVTPWAVDGGTYLSSLGGEMVQMPLEPQGEFLSLPLAESGSVARPLPQIATHYTWQGVVHILEGWDHLAFVLCLCLLARGRFLLALVTTFTLGHSLSLALAFFDVVRVPVPPVEAVIALSIAFMAREALLARGQGIAAAGAGDRRRQLAIVAGFGLLHGLGFATVLRELGVAAGERASGLVFFNAGVELGQLVFVAFVLAVLALARLVGQREPVRALALYGAGIIGCFWTIERVASFALGIV